ncbi:MAG: hypothetical protein P4L22_05080 [Candidatus Babeliales bacterium]|nr:hypothetical protein [Candidatus Babeliales bacterium]
MIKKIFLTLLFISFNTKSETIIYQKPLKAVCIVPVADLIGFSYKALTPNTQDQYRKIALSGYKGNLNCVRDHQLLFNETIEILEEHDEEVKINIFNAFVQDYATTYWALKENFINAELLDHTKIPTQIDFRNTNFAQPYTNLVTLILPFKDSKTDKTYSAGTRFIYKSKDNTSYIIYTYNTELKDFTESIVSKDICLESQEVDKSEKIKKFVKLLKLWTNLEDNQIVPFAWGGCSLIDKVKNNEFVLTDGTNLNNEPIQHWTREELTRKPYSGFDASGLILRAAQICEIPYFYKNTVTASKFLKSLTPEDTLQLGDIIWFAGYLAAISDIKNNLVIGGRGYQHGYGKIIEQPLNHLFKDVNNFSQLLEAYYNQTPLENIDKNGQDNRTVKEFKILKLESCWKTI